MPFQGPRGNGITGCTIAALTGGMIRDLQKMEFYRFFLTCRPPWAPWRRTNSKDTSNLSLCYDFLWWKRPLVIDRIFSKSSLKSTWLFPMSQWMHFICFLLKKSKTKMSSFNFKGRSGKKSSNFVHSAQCSLAHAFACSLVHSLTQYRISANCARKKIAYF